MREAMHLRQTEIDRYLRRELDESTLAAMDAQASVSLPWARLLARRGMEGARWERRGLLRRLVRVDRQDPARDR
jgi:hypothetical protein